MKMRLTSLDEIAYIMMFHFDLLVFGSDGQVKSFMDITGEAASFHKTGTRRFHTKRIVNTFG